MPLDYSRFDHIEDSDCESQHGIPDIANLVADDDGDDFSQTQFGADGPPESPRTRLMRHAQGQAAVERKEENTTETLQASFERFVQLVEGAQAVSGEDVVELVACARATIQSAIAGQVADSPCRFVQAFAVGLGGPFDKMSFAQDQAPEFVAELLAAGSSSLVPAEQCEQILDLMVKHCKAQEIYTFLLAALCDNDLCWEARLRGIKLLKEVLLRMKNSKRHLFLPSCLPLLMRRSMQATGPGKLACAHLEALLDFAKAFVNPAAEGDLSCENEPGSVVQAMVSAFLFKVLQTWLPAVTTIEDLSLVFLPSEEAVHDPQQDESIAMTPGCKRQRVLQAKSGICAEDAFAALLAVAKSAARFSKVSIIALLEELDVGDPTGDGGGDLELSPLCCAAFLCLHELCGCVRRLFPQSLPTCLSPVRRLNVLMRSCLVLLANKDDASALVTMCTDGKEDSGDRANKGPRWPQRGLVLFAESAFPLMSVVASQTPQAYTSLCNPLCCWYPPRIFQALLEALTSTPDLERETRSVLFRNVVIAMRMFEWPCRFNMYIEIIQRCRVDSVIGALVTTFKDDWWAHVMNNSHERTALGDECQRLVKLLKATLSGDVQIVDGMDTLTASLNIVRLVALARPPAGPQLRARLRGEGTGLDLDGMLAGISTQIDFELKVLDQAEQDGASSGPSQDFALALQEAFGKADEGMNLNSMKKDRISMVAHLVARVRELLSAACD